MTTTCFATLVTKINVTCYILGTPSANRSKGAAWHHCIANVVFSEHAQNGSIKNHILQHHPTRKVKTKELLNDVSFLYSSNVKTTLTLAEALYLYINLNLK